MKFLKLLKKDFDNCTKDKNTTALFKVVLFSHSLHMVFAIRLGQSLREIKFLGGALGLIVEYFIRIIFASDISCKSKIGGGLMIVHGHDIVIGGDVVIGENCKIFNGVTLGNKNTESGINHQPTVGDGVVLSTGCKILGGILIGSNAVVGANSVVLMDVPCGSIAVGVPAVIKNKAV